MRYFLFLVCFLFISFLRAQEAINELPHEIEESSALLLVKDSLLVTLNDSGGLPMLYFLNFKAELIHKSKLCSSTNVDWEALTSDGDNRLFIGDIGNNKNDRKNLCVYEVQLLEALEKDSIIAQKISFSYPDQVDFPPADSLLYFDAEAMEYSADSLFIFTKNRTVPFDGIVKVYGLSTSDTNQIARKYPDINLRPSHWTEDCVTDASLKGDTLFLLTYSKIYTFVKENRTYKEISVQQIDYPTQIEGMTYKNGYFYLTDEKTKLSNPQLYRLKRKK